MLYESQPILWHFKFQSTVNVTEFRNALACQYSIHSKRLVGVYNSTNETVLHLYGSDKDTYYYGPLASTFHTSLVSDFSKKSGIFNQTYTVADFQFVLPVKAGMTHYNINLIRNNGHCRTTINDYLPHFCLGHCTCSIVPN